ncbi:MAG: adenosylcobinamide-GDP ribazoletransferase [Peptococcaceae bacterium]|jgi:adenosylcobinamide-GDP ribazoletransferase|nr:adenosylcobinamide-GDP ribazoletransferase [Peptococcaceae bacterium]
MKAFIESFIVAFSMYSKIPMPQLEWNEKNMRFSLAVFPIVGVLIAGALYFLFYIFTHLNFSPVFFGAVAVFLPILITGGLHLDGYCDTVDALCSRKERSEKLRILKDPHTGAFAVIYTVALLILQFGAWCQVFLTPVCFYTLLFCFIFSRALVSLSLVTFPCAGSTGLASIFAGNTSKGVVKYILACMIILCLAAMFYLMVVAASVILILVLASYIWFYFMTRKHFGGLTGDLAGFYIVVCETLVLLTAAILGGIMA